MRRRWLFWLLVALFAWVVVSRQGELERLAQVLSHGAWEWLAVAIACELVYYCGNAFLNYRTLRLAGVGGTFLAYLPLSFAALFMNVTLPAAGTGGIALYADFAARRGDSPARATAGALLVHVLNQTSFVPFLVWTDYYLASHGALSAYHQLISGLFMLFALSQAGILLLALQRPAALRALLGWVKTAVNGTARLFHRPPALADSWAERSAGEFSTAAEPIRQSPGKVAALLGVSVVLHSLHMVTLWAMFRAFSGPVQFAIPMISYVISFLFVTISITPQGVGFVEEAMTSTMVALGVSTAEAAVLPFAYRGLSLWVPLGIGFLAMRRLSTTVGARRPLRAAWLVRVSSLLVCAVAVMDTVYAVLPATVVRQAMLDALGLAPIGGPSRIVTILVAYGLLLNVRGLLRRQRSAWSITLVLLAISLFSNLVLRFDYARASLVLSAIVLLSVQRGSYYARAERVSLADAGRALLSALGFTLVLAAGGSLLLTRHFAEHPSWSGVLRYVPALVGVPIVPALTPSTGHAALFITMARWAGGATLAYALGVFVQAVTRRPPATRAERSRAEQIVRAQGTSPLAHLALFPDKAYSFGPGESVIAWVRKGRVALALGDPIAPPAADLAAINAFVANCQERALLPAFHLVSAEHLDSYHRAEFHTMLIGYETSVNLARLDHGPFEDPALRASEQRLAQRGHTMWAYSPPLSSVVMDELETVSDEWLDSRRQSETRFSLGWFDEAYIRTCPVIVVRDASGALTAFANIVVAGGSDYATVDVVRHRLDAMPGTLEFLLLASFRWAAGRGAQRFSLGLTLPVEPPGSADLPHPGDAAQRLAAHLGALHGFQGLRHLYLRFAPEPSPRYLAYRREEDLPRIVDAIIAADLGVRAWGATLPRLADRRSRLGARHRTDPTR